MMERDKRLTGHERGQSVSRMYPSLLHGADATLYRMNLQHLKSLRQTVFGIQNGSSDHRSTVHTAVRAVLNILSLSFSNYILPHLQFQT